MLLMTQMARCCFVMVWPFCEPVKPTGSPASWTGWLKVDVVSTFRIKDTSGQSMTPEPLGFHRRQDSLVDRACSSPTRFAGALASRNAALTATCCLDSPLRSKCLRGSKGDKHRASSTNRTHAGAVGRVEGCTFQAHLRNRYTSLWLPSVPPSHVHTFRVDQDHLWLTRSCRNVNMVETGQCTASRFLLWHQLLKLHLLAY